MSEPLRARDVMTRNVTTMSATTSVRETIALCRAHAFSGFPVVDDRGRAIGLISQNDVLRALAFAVGPGYQPGSFASEEDRRRASVHLLEAADDEARHPVALDELLARPVRDLMTPVVWKCSPDTPLAQVCDVMVQRRIHRVVVCDDDKKVVGLIAALDLVRELRAHLGGE